MGNVFSRERTDAEQVIEPIQIRIATSYREMVNKADDLRTALGIM